MKAGRLTEEIRIERSTSTINEYGTPSTTWVKLALLRAEKVEQTTTKYIRNFGASDEEVVIFRTRFLDGITNADRLVWKGNAFNIQSVATIGRRTGVELRCVRLPE
ncbi:phage head closure protein [Paracoccus sp. SY]|uniref:phage head closure protein n=1 Tax=Paracoccus sp. SY TaxID=1330255 RepID=UPI000CCFE8EB|nr:phage head closure protein [Paracoccus sp. SY]